MDLIADIKVLIVFLWREVECNYSWGFLIVQNYLVHSCFGVDSHQNENKQFVIEEVPGELFINFDERLLHKVSFWDKVAFTVFDLHVCWKEHNGAACLSFLDYFFVCENLEFSRNVQAKLFVFSRSIRLNVLHFKGRRWLFGQRTSNLDWLTQYIFNLSTEIVLLSGHIDQDGCIMADNWIRLHENDIVLRRLPHPFFDVFLEFLDLCIDFCEAWKLIFLVQEGDLAIRKNFSPFIHFVIDFLSLLRHFILLRFPVQFDGC